ncbi:Methyltransferase trt5, partial [Trichoderma lentiforme]
EVEDHLRDIRDRAWKVFPYGCIGRWLFLNCVITSSSEYSHILKRLEAGEVLLDAGCAFGYVLRQLAFDGSPASNLIGTDLQQVIAGDLLEPEDPSLDSIDGKVDIIHAAALFHLFDWDDQVTLGSRLVKFFKPDANAMLVGRQIGTLYPPKRGTQKDQKAPGWYRHNLETWQQMWDEIGDKTGTQWRVRGTLQEM